MEVSALTQHAVEEGAPEEPTIRDVFSAISTCNITLETLNLHMGGLKEDMAHIRMINERFNVAEAS